MVRAALSFSIFAFALFLHSTQAYALAASDYVELISVEESATITGAVDIAYNILDASVVTGIAVERYDNSAVIPTVSQYGVIMLLLLLLIYGLWHMHTGKGSMAVVVGVIICIFPVYKAAAFVHSDWVTLTPSILTIQNGAGVYTDYPPATSDYSYRLSVCVPSYLGGPVGCILDTDAKPVTVTATEGNFSATGELNYGSWPYFGPWIMSDGKILVIKNKTGGEIFDTSSKTWAVTRVYNSSTSFMGACRIDGTDKIIILIMSVEPLFGTINQESTTLVYDYSTDTWSQIGSFIKPRINADIACLSNGKVLLTGGELYEDASAGNYVSTTSVEIYDPATEVWSLAASMNNARAFHGSEVLSDGRLLVVGGVQTQNGQADPVSEYTAEVYDPDTDSWTATGNLNDGRSRPEAILLDDGKVLVAGGSLTQYGYLDSAEIYDPSTNIWTLTGSMSDRKLHFEFVRMADGKVMAIGGRFQDMVWSIATINGVDQWIVSLNGIYILRTLEIYDSSTGVWAETTNMAEKREYHFGITLSDGGILIGGGWDSADTYYATAMIYTP